MTDIVKSVGVSVKLARENIKLLARAEKAEADNDRLREFVEAVASENLTLLAEIERLRAALWAIMLNSHNVYATEIAHAALEEKA